MASSPIRINEATVEELQTLKGIGPKRAEYICRYREEVALIKNTFDLAAATGLSLKAADRMTRDISWETESNEGMTLWPAALTTIAAIWLIVLGFNELANEPFVPPGGYYNLALALILLGGFTATGDVAIASVRHRPSETSWVFTLALVLALSGILLLASLYVASAFMTFDAGFTNTLANTLQFIIFCLIIAWQIYAPVVMIRLLIGDRNIERLETARLVYDLSLFILPLLAACVVYWRDSEAWTEEIFMVWCLVIAALAARERLNQGTVFVSMLSEEDQGRLRFSYLRRSAA